jgi:hypothetical protein
MTKEDASPDQQPETHASGDPDLDSLHRFQSAVRQQDDRALVLSLAAFAEDTLGRLFLVYMREEKQARELVEGFNAPLGTFSARIKAAFTFGLLTREQFEDLEIARRVRNAFAHNWEGISIESPDVKALIGKLHAYSFNQAPLASDGRERLLGAISTILIELRVQITEHKRQSRRAPLVGFRLAAVQLV